MVIGLLCLIVLSAYVIVNFDLSVFMKTPSGQWLLQKITVNKEHITRTNTSGEVNTRVIWKVLSMAS